MGTPSPSDEPVKVRNVDGVVPEGAPGLRPAGDEGFVDGVDRWAVLDLWDQNVYVQQLARTRGRLDVSGTSPRAGHPPGRRPRRGAPGGEVIPYRR